MKPEELVRILGVLEKLKCVPRHCVTSTGRVESVAEHSWRLAVMALLVKDEFPSMDMAKVVKMCLLHDWPEAVTGDVPAFKKNERHEADEAAALETMLAGLPQPYCGEYRALFAEMAALVTPEARLCKALDKLEALIQHNEADISSWLPLEYELQMTYGDEETAWFGYTRELRELVRKMSKQKIDDKEYGNW